MLGIFIFLCIWYAATKFTSLGKVMPDPVTVIAGFCKAFVVPIGTHSMIMHIQMCIRDSCMAAHDALPEQYERLGI